MERQVQYKRDRAGEGANKEGKGKGTENKNEKGRERAGERIEKGFGLWRAARDGIERERAGSERDRERAERVSEEGERGEK